MPALDAGVAWLKWADPRPWGLRPVLVPFGVLVALVLGGALAVTVAPSGGNARLVFAVVVNLAAEAGLAVGLWFGGRGIARRYGTWRIFGWQRPRWVHLAYAVGGIVLSFVLRGVVVAAANAMSNGRAVKAASNLPRHHLSGTSIALFAVIVVVCAPVVEEVMFRGLILRTFMRRFTFWPAALMSSALFGVAHTYEVASLLGAVVLALNVGCLGLVNCLLVRRTDNLTPAILVHAATNGLAVIALAAGVTAR